MSPDRNDAAGPRRRLGLDVVRGQQFGDEVAVVVGDAAGQVAARQLLALALELGGHDDVDAVGLAAHLVVDPGQLLVELLGRERGRAEHAEAAGVGHRGDDVAAVAEGEEREVDAELSQIRLHEPVCAALRPATYGEVRAALQA